MIKRSIANWFEGKLGLRQSPPVVRSVSVPKAVANRRTPLLQHGPVPAVAIVTPVRNRKAWTQSFLQQIDRQTYPFIRVYIVDADSTDGTPDLVRSTSVANVTLIQVSDRNYWTGATNAGVKRALSDGCDYILTLNDDAVVPATFVEKLVETAVAHRLDILGSTISYSAEPGRIWGLGAYNDWANGNFLQTLHANQWADDIYAMNEEVIAVPCLCGNGTLVKSSIFGVIGLYDSKYTPHYHGDTEFTLRAAKHGTPSYVSTQAWIYNRFFEETDGAFTDRNKRFFSLRSSNYLKPLLYILTQHCPPELWVSSFCRYMERYASSLSSRKHSIVVRVSQCLALAARDSFKDPSIMTSSGDSFLDRARDFSRTLQFDKSEFLDIASLLVLRRSFTPEERRHYEKFISTLDSRKIVLLDLMKRPEFSVRYGSPPELLLTLTDGAAVVDASSAENSQRVICNLWSRLQRLPTTQEFQAEVRSHQHRALEVSSKSLGVSAQVVRSEPKAIIYFNVDVLCMGQIDHRARTGVYRYAEALVDRFLTDERIDTRLFFSSGLDVAWDELVRQKPKFSLKLVSEPLLTVSADCEQAVFYPYFPYAAPDSRFSTLPVFLTLCDLFPVTNPEWFTEEATSNFKRQLRYLMGADHIFCISKETQSQLLAYAPSISSASSVAYLGVAAKPHQFEPGYIEKLGLSRGSRYMLCIGTLEPRKNLGTVIRAFELLDKAEFNDVYLIVVGATGWNVDLAEVALALGDRLKFVGRVDDDDLWTLYNYAVCTVFPSLAEGFGFPIIESFACGTPVITSNCSSMKEIASDGAFLVNPMDEREIAEAMVQLLKGGERREELITKGRQVASTFTWEASAEAHVSKIISVLASLRGSSI